MRLEVRAGLPKTGKAGQIGKTRPFTRISARWAENSRQSFLTTCILRNTEAAVVSAWGIYSDFVNLGDTTYRLRLRLRVCPCFQ